MSKPTDPEEFRMSIGEHLEELRWRILFGLGGLALVVVLCLIFGDRVMEIFCAPLSRSLERMGLNPQIHYDRLEEGFLVWVQVNLITAVAIASPWLVYQIWQFVASGLYPHERKYVTRYAPMSIGLLISGLLFVYFLVLPWSIQFFLDFANSIPLPHTSGATSQVHTATTLPSLLGDPTDPKDNEIWIDSHSGQIKIFFDHKIRAIRFSSENLLTPDIKLAEYIDLVTGMLLTFGLSFQLPLVVLALVRIGIVEVQQLKAMRRYIYFVLVILACAITPGDVVTASVLLTIPLVFLYELGIWMARAGKVTAKSQ